jgi:hypothetical protein
MPEEQYQKTNPSQRLHFLPSLFYGPDDLQKSKKKVLSQLLTDFRGVTYDKM